MIETALSGLRVVDLTQYVAGPYCTKLLADYGADVVKVERPGGGDLARRAGPFPNDEPDPERSALFLNLNTNKRSVAADLKSAEGRDVVLRLAASADVLVENFRPSVLPSLGLSYEVLKRHNPGLVMTSITDFGQTGPYRDFRGSEIVDYALGGAYHCSGAPGRRPVKLGGNVVQLLAGAQAAGATIAAVFGREVRGRGDHVDISIMQTQAGSPDRRTPMLVGYQYTGHVNRQGEVSVSPVRPCKDGHVNVYVAPSRLADIYDMMGMPELKEDPRFGDPVQVLRPENTEALEGILIGWLMDRSMVEVWQAAQGARVISGPVYSVADLLKDPHFRARRYWESIDHPAAGTFEYPGMPFSTPGVPRRPRRAAPRLDEHAEEVAAEMAALETRPRPPARAGAEGLPLKGLRVLDLTVVLAGPNATTLLADWGAEVIRVEPVSRLQPITRGHRARPTQELVDANRNWLVAYPGWEPGDHPWNRWPHFNAHGRNKSSMTLNLDEPEGARIFRELVSISDVVFENNVPATIDKLRLGYAELRKIRPDLVMVRMPAYGLEGPYAGYRSLGAHLEGTAAHTYVRGYPDTDPSERDDVYFGDAVAAATSAAAVLMALYRRRRTGEGGVVEVAQAESLIPFFGDIILDYQMNGRIAQAQANDLYGMAPHNTYPCKGEHRWVAIAVGSDDQWSGFVEALGRPAWADGPAFASKAGRYEHRAKLDALIDEWTSRHEAGWVMETLQRHGVPCGVLNDEAMAFDDPHLRARGFFETLQHPECGEHEYPGIVWRMEETPNRIRSVAPVLGQHNDWACRELLGLQASEIEALERAGHLASVYPPHVI